MAKSQYSHSMRLSERRRTQSPGFTPASTRPDATARTSRCMSDHVRTCHGPSPWRWWTSARSRYLAICRNNTPTVVRSEIASTSIACVDSVALRDVVLLPSQIFGGRVSSGACPAAGRVGFADAAKRGNRQVPSHYLTALIVSVRVPEGTLTVTLSPFFLPTSARPTGESTAVRPADGALSTEPTRWEVSLSPSLSTTSIVDPGSTTLEWVSLMIDARPIIS